MVRIGEDAPLGQQLLQPADFYFCFLAFQNLGITNQLFQFGNLNPQVIRIERGNGLFEFGKNFLLFFVGQIVEIVRQPLGNLFLPEFSWIFEESSRAFPSCAPSVLRTA